MRRSDFHVLEIPDGSDSDLPLRCSEGWKRGMVAKADKCDVYAVPRMFCAVQE